MRISDWSSDLFSSDLIILIRPTWRSSLMGSIVSGNQRTINGDFMASNYAIAWGSFLKSERLRTISIQAGYRILFSPHANIQPYLSKFALPDYIDVISHESCSIQEMFCRSRSEARRVGKECVSTCISRWSPYI